MREVFYGVISQGVAPYFFMSEEMICSFFGHRDIDITEDLYNKALSEIMKAIEFGCRVFYFGGFGDFDDLCYKIVTKLKEDMTELNIRSIYCVSQERYLRKNSPYFNRASYDELTYLIPSFGGWYKSIYFRNCAMIDASDYVIFYAEKRENSGAYKAYKYATGKKKSHIINLWED